MVARLTWSTDCVAVVRIDILCVKGMHGQSEGKGGTSLANLILCTGPLVIYKIMWQSDRTPTCVTGRRRQTPPLQLQQFAGYIIWVI